MTTLRFDTRIIGLTATILAMAASGPLTLAVAHERHQMKCDKTRIQAMKVDIQAMISGEAKTAAMRR
jgi:hypothetical protein